MFGIFCFVCLGACVYCASVCVCVCVCVTDWLTDRLYVCVFWAKVENTRPLKLDSRNTATAVPQSRSRRIIKTERVELVLPQSRGPEVEE